MGAGGIVLLLLLILWVIPARMGAVQAEEEWELQVQELRGLRLSAKEIPSMSSLKSVTEYRRWLDDQAKLVEAFFADRAAVLEAPVAGEGAVTPVDFKENYLRATLTQRRWLDLNKDRMSLADISRAFPTYDWTRGEGFAKPSEYLDIMRDYWARVILYRTFMGSEVKLVKRLELGKVVSLTPEFEAIPVQMDVTLPADKVTVLMDTLLTVSPSGSIKPIVNLERMSLRPELVGQRVLCGLSLDGYMLLLRRAPPAAKVEKSKP